MYCAIHSTIINILLTFSGAVKRKQKSLKSLLSLSLINLTILQIEKREILIFKYNNHF